MYILLLTIIRNQNSKRKSIMAFENIEELEQSFIGRTLTSMNFYNVNDDYFVFNPDNLAVIDGGIELMFEEGILVIAWNAEEELFDVSTNSIKSLLADLDYYQVDSGDLPLGQQLLGSKVASLKANGTGTKTLIVN